MRYFFHIGYHGFKYRGWQRQPLILSVQQVLESALSQILKTSVIVIGCGRTDAQVHASQFFFHVDIENRWEYDLLFRINKILPNDIAVFEIIPMDGLPHARFDATKRTYDYFIHTYKDPFLSRMSSLYQETNLDLEKMREATSLLSLYNDYRALCKTPDDNKHTICNVTSAKLYSNAKGDKIRFEISSNRFLTKMVRIIVGKLLEIGRGELSVETFESYLITKKTPKSIEPAYPQGLYLSKVTYPYLDIPPKSEFLTMLRHQVDEWLVV